MECGHLGALSGVGPWEARACHACVEPSKLTAVITFKNMDIPLCHRCMVELFNAIGSALQTPKEK